MKISYHHIRRPPLSGRKPGLEASPEYGNRLLKFTRVLESVQRHGTPVNARTRALCQAVTICEIYPEAGEDFAPVMGVAFCCDKDQFSRKMGRRISYGRARGEIMSTILPITRGPERRQNHENRHVQQYDDGETFRAFVYRGAIAVYPDRRTKDRRQTDES